MKVKFYLTFLLCLYVFASCSQEEDVQPVFSIETTGDITIASSANSKISIRFTSSREWEASTSVDWLTISPAQGEAGSASLSVTANSENTAKDTREAIITLKSGEVTQSITISQDPAEYVKPEKNTYDFGAEGGSVVVNFTTNVPQGELTIWSYKDGDWLINDVDTRIVFSNQLKLKALPNTGVWRSTSIILARGDIQKDGVILATIVFNQAAGNVQTSTDFSADGKIRTLQIASKGSGIPIVIVGDGFIDKEIVDGTYDKVMDKAMDNFFTEEPVKSLREYFNVYAVTAVSKNNSFGVGYETAIKCKLAGGNSTAIEGDDDRCMEYAQKVANLNLNETLVIVILNTPAYAGTTNFGYIDNNKMIEFAIAYCPVIDNLNSEHFRAVLCHEAIGHGFAKLLDEYSYEEQGTIPVEEVARNRDIQSIGWAMNVDFTNDPTRVKWNKFLTDNRYAWENLSVIEGACTYIKGAYRPTKNSMMRDNNERFNAPSREAIYKRVIRSSSLTDWKYDYETFVAFDLAHIDKTPRITRAVGSSNKPFAAPRFMNKPLIKK